LGAQLRLGARQAAFPVPTQVGRARAGGAPGVERLGRNLERGVLDAEVLLGGGELVLAQRGAVDAVRTGLIRRAEADGRLGRDQRRLVGLLGASQRLLDRGLIVA